MVVSKRASVDLAHEEPEKDDDSLERRVNLAEAHLVPFAEMDDYRVQRAHSKGISVNT